MTNEKAIEVLEYARNYDGMDYGAPSIALDMAISALRAQQEKNSPCDLCIYDPPSSMGGKPCLMCPARRRRRRRRNE